MFTCLVYHAGKLAKAAYEHPVSLGSTVQRSCTRPQSCSPAGKVPQSCVLSGACSSLSSTACFRAFCGKRQSELSPESATAKTMCIYGCCFRAGTAAHTGKHSASAVLCKMYVAFLGLLAILRSSGHHVMYLYRQSSICVLMSFK